MIHLFFRLMPTYRQRIIELLSQGSYTPYDLSLETGLSVKDILHHLTHVRKSIRPPYRFLVRPAECLKCDFVFKDRKKLHRPSKCPKCKGTLVQDPSYWVGDDRLSQDENTP